ncbi:MAG TPA: DUF1697 domain-containing protein [Thermoplasmata archaeon]|nr:DUF1697 domain-containing protein [Thermoplasmata archaeon]
MPAYVGLLRAVNLGEGTLVRMEELRSLLEKEGLDQVRTLLNSGNIVFRSSSRSGATLERSLSDKIARSFHVKTELFLRSAHEWETIVAHNPFLTEARVGPGHLLVLVLRDSPSPDRWRALQGAIRGRERFQEAGRHAYVVYPDGVGRSKFTSALIESKLETAGTLRNWNTVTKLGALVGGLEGARANSR